MGENKNICNNEIKSRLVKVTEVYLSGLEDFFPSTLYRKRIYNCSTESVLFFFFFLFTMETTELNNFNKKLTISQMVQAKKAFNRT